MELRLFAERLDERCREVARDLGISREEIRPFVCRGTPLAQKTVFVVGANPASSDGAFWNHWNGGAGFDYEGWSSAYRASRIARGKRALSPTRRRLELFTKSVRRGRPDVAVIETNVFAVSSDASAQLPSQFEDSRIFTFLVEELTPTFVIAHGRKAHDAVGRHYGCELDANSDRQIGHVRVMGRPHFSGQGAAPGTMSDAMVERLAEEVAARLG